MKIVCVSCRSEGRDGLIGERPPFDDPRATTGVCWTHKLEMLRKTRGDALRRGPSGESAVRFLVIVARQPGDLHDQLAQNFLDDPRVQVLLDRRGGERRRARASRQPDRRRNDRRRMPDYWEDTRHHPVVIVPTWKKAAWFPVPTTPTDEDRTMEATHNTAQTAPDLEAWIRDSQHMMARVIPSLLEESQDLRRRAELAEAAAAHRQREIEDLQGDVTRLGNEVDRLTKERAAVVATVERGMTSIARLAGEVLTALKER